jgi:hypothetical protein
MKGQVLQMVTLRKKVALTSTSILMLAAALTFTGCSNIVSERNLTNMHGYMVSEGKPPAYVDGYIDGCSSGRSLAGDKNYQYRRDNFRVEQDALYARGWEDGQITCRNECIVERQQLQGVAPVAGSSDQEKRRQEEAELRAMWDEIKK